MEDMLCWDVTPSGGRSTEGWVKYDLESGVTDTQWLNNAVSDAMDDAEYYDTTPLAYLEALLDNVEAPALDVRRALICALLRATAEARKR